MNFNIGEMMEELTATTKKMTAGYETLKNIEDVEVGTTPKDLVWQQDHVSMYRYRRDTPATCKTPVLVSFALMNRHDVLDLQPDRSLMARLLDAGLDVYIMDWGYPTRQHRYTTLEDYILGYMNDAVDHVREASKCDKINKIGICQGGTFSMIYASIFPEKLNTLTTFVAPYDFGLDNMLYKWSKNLDIDSVIDAHGMMTGDMIDGGFGMLNPTMEIGKYLGVMDSLDNEAKMTNFLRMEKWKADQPSVCGELFRKYIKDLWRDNKLVKGEMTLGEHEVNLKNVKMPVLTIYAEHDTIIPPASTIPVNKLIGSKDKELYKFPGGHIGVFVGGRSQKELGPKVGEWISTRSK